MKRAVFLDRDGVINRKAPEGRYVTHWEEMHFLPQAAAAISLFNRAGFLVIVISNQRCVAKGLITGGELELLHERMSSALARAGATIDAIYYCPHEADDHCSCRKPAPGMLLRAMQEYGIEPATSWMIGDSETDVEAGKNAGCRTAHLMSARRKAPSRADVVAPLLLEAAQKILQWEERRYDARGEFAEKRSS